MELNTIEYVKDTLHGRQATVRSFVLNSVCCSTVTAVEHNADCL